MGASGSALVGFSGAAAASTDAEDVDVTTLSGDERTKAITEARSDPLTKRIRAALTESGWRSNASGATCLESDPPGAEPYRIVVVPFERSGSNQPREEQVNLRWIDEVPAGTELDRVVGHRAVPLDRAENTDRQTDWETTTYQVDSGDVVSRTSQIDTETVEPSQVIAPPPGGGCDHGCWGGEYECESYDWQCIISIATGFAGALRGCAPCAAEPTKALCGLCLAGVIIEGYALPCSPGENCGVEYSCHPCHCDEPTPPGC